MIKGNFSHRDGKTPLSGVGPVLLDLQGGGVFVSLTLSEAGSLRVSAIRRKRSKSEVLLDFSSKSS